MKKFKPKSSNGGFTLVEVIISVAVLCLVCGVMLRLFVSADDLREKNLDIEKAQVYVLNEMEKLKSKDEPLTADILSEPDFDGSFTLTQYYDSNWKGVQSWENPRYILVTIIVPSEEGLFTKGAFGVAEDQRGVSSALFDIKVSMRDIERKKVLASVESAHYYRNMGDNND
ncbi:MAG: type II secretion system protein [Clostridia bacterium]|nr:type II secretion system protein [Clostridia bacterium]MBN2883662.1 type II secretion system protein [Clostridia bacterium]